ncbi:MAG: hypothetical protein R3F56_20110 [Planctomycetota bacterium]
MSEITREQFLAERSPRRGAGNPQRMCVPVWEWLVRAEISAWEANQKFQGPDPSDAGPGWCFDRHGCSRTELPDGRVVHIAGEHEDHYDPDFYIYNDVVVRYPGDRVAIFGYSEHAFPPTDFHSATLVGDQIVVLGNLGYPERRCPGHTPVHLLHLDALRFSELATRGDAPGWIFKHTAELADDGNTLVVRGGTIHHEHDVLRDNVDDFALALPQGTWTRLTRRPWQQWAVHRADGDDLLLFFMELAALYTQFPDARPDGPANPALAAAGVETDPFVALKQAGCRFDLATYRQLYHGVGLGDPAGEWEHPVRARYRLDAAEVTYEESSDAVRLKVVGHVETARVRALCEELRAKLERLQGTACVVAFEGGNGRDDR